jgi:hypothetical protein
MLECWNNFFAARDSVKEFQLKVEKKVNEKVQKEREKNVEEAPGKSKVSLGALLRNTSPALQESRKGLLRQNATEALVVSGQARTDSRVSPPPPSLLEHPVPASGNMFLPKTQVIQRHNQAPYYATPQSDQI